MVGGKQPWVGRWKLHHYDALVLRDGIEHLREPCKKNNGACQVPKWILICVPEPAGNESMEGTVCDSEQPEQPWKFQEAVVSRIPTPPSLTPVVQRCQQHNILFWEGGPVAPACKLDIGILLETVGRKLVDYCTTFCVETCVSEISRENDWSAAWRRAWAKRRFMAAKNKGWKFH